MNLMTARGVFKDSSAHRNSIELQHCVASISPAVSTAVSLNTRRGGTRKKERRWRERKSEACIGFLIIARLSPPLRFVRERIRLLGLARHKRVLTYIARKNKRRNRHVCTNRSRAKATLLSFPVHSATRPFEFLR